LAQGAKLTAANIANIGKGSDNAMGQNSCQPEGLQPKPAARCSVEQGPRLRGCNREGAHLSCA